MYVATYHHGCIVTTWYVYCDYMFHNIWCNYHILFFMHTHFVYHICRQVVFIVEFNECVIVYYIIIVSLYHIWWKFHILRLKKLCVKIFMVALKLTSSESQGQEEATCACQAYATTGVLFTGTSTMKVASAVTR